MIHDEQFFLRWSRRKRNSSKPEAGIPASLPIDDNGRVSPAAPLLPTLSNTVDPAPVEQSAGDPADLPDINQLRADADLSQFMKPNVPTAVRNAALRRMWVLDPAIRDYVCEAREYAYDWNSGGDVPGYGPVLDPDAVTLAQRVIVSVPRPTQCHDSTMSTAVSHQIAVRLTDNAVPNDGSGCNEGAEEVHVAHGTALGKDDTRTWQLDSAYVSAFNRQTAVYRGWNDGPPRTRRRHGGATPT
jgi:hypothetical protein